MGYDRVRGIATYGPRCLPGATRLLEYLQDRYDAGSLGCYNPASVTPSGTSLHAEGRAIDVQLNANDPAQRARGDALMHELVDHHDAYGLQELLWRGYVWSYRRRSEGIRFGTQQAEHMSHVHVGLDVDAGLSWSTARLPAAPKPIKKELPAMFIAVENESPHRNVLVDAGIACVGLGTGEPFTEAMGELSKRYPGLVVVACTPHEMETFIRRSVA